ncbi:tetratricopeptide repeat protein [Neochlamydia sp. S13]|uniref:tetratricopeptide repeat protein n=1 Tax=Neochlamydia sp. S13 TaxID=1353976 RepID=UPI0005A9FE61|nr:tetratricopeptide repeat protein [Neochlamydia sp. S13]BBI17799.1 hypothetical protein NCS13_1_1604 [Neochlamydia sp. S13]
MNLESLSTPQYIFPVFKEMEETSTTSEEKTVVYTEIALRIFTRLALQDLCRTELVCKKWKQIIHENKSQLIERNNLYENFYLQYFKAALRKEKEQNDAGRNIKLSKGSDFLTSTYPTLHHSIIRNCIQWFNQTMPSSDMFWSPYYSQKLQPYLGWLSDCVNRIAYFIFRSDKFFSPSKREVSYVLELKLAVQKKDFLQESLCIEKLGDIYVEKRTSKTLLQAAGLYNYALKRHSLLSSSEDKGEILKEKLFKAQNLLIKLCEGEPISLEQMQKQFESNRSALKKFREEVEKKIQVLGPNPSSQQVKELYQGIALHIKSFFGFLVKQAIDILGPAPCEYAMIGFGSLAREEMTPYSDLEFGILIEKDSSSSRNYFRHLTALLHLKVINLGETILPALNIPRIKEIDFFDSITPRGFAFDGEGVEGKGCKTPLGNGITFELIQTTEKMSQYVAKDEKGQWWHEKEPHLPMELLTFTHLLGNPELTKQYEEKVQEKLKVFYQEGSALRQYLAKQHLFYQDMVTFYPGLGDLKTQGMLFKAKNDFYRFPHLALDRLALLKEISAMDTFTRIDRLKEKKVLNKDSAKKLKEWMSVALLMRLRTYCKYKAQNEMMNPLIQPFGLEDPTLIQKQLALDNAALAQIKKIYRVFIPFGQAIIHMFSSGEEDSLKLSTLDDSPEMEGAIALRLFQHQEAEKRYKQASEKDSKNSHVLNALGMIYLEQKRLDEAARCINQALEINKESYNKNFIALARDYNNMGMVYQAQGDAGQAARYTKIALAIKFSLQEKDYETLATYYNNLSSIYLDQGKLKKAVMYVKKALEINLKLFRENALSTAVYYNNLGMIYKDQMKLDKAARYVNQALEINSKMFDENHPRVAHNHHNLGVIYYEQGNLEKASASTHEALRIRRKFFGENHPILIGSYSALGMIYYDQGRLNEAAKYLNHALIINRNLARKNDPETVQSFSNLANIYQEQGNLKQAIECIEAAWQIAYKLYKENHPIMAIIYANRGKIYQTQGNLIQAAKDIEQALKIDRRIFGEKHPKVAFHYINLGVIYLDQSKLGEAALVQNNLNKKTPVRRKLDEVVLDQKKVEEAARCINQALSIDSKLFGKNYRLMASFYNGLAQLIYKAQGNLKEAKKLIRQALAIDKKIFGKNHPKVARDYNNLGMNYEALGKFEKAIKYVNKALKIDREIFGKDHPRMASGYSNLGLVYKAKGEFKKAAKYAERAFEINRKVFGENHPKMADCYRNLTSIYQAQGDGAKAVFCFQNALRIELQPLLENNPNMVIRYSPCKIDSKSFKN